MPLLSNARCRIGQHEPNRRKVRWDGIAHFGKCRHCGVNIERHGHKDWREIGEPASAERAKLQLKQVSSKIDNAAKQAGAKLKGLITKRSNPDHQPR